MLYVWRLKIYNTSRGCFSESAGRHILLSTKRVTRHQNILCVRHPQWCSSLLECWDKHYVTLSTEKFTADCLLSSLRAFLLDGFVFCGTTGSSWTSCDKLLANNFCIITTTIRFLTLCSAFLWRASLFPRFRTAYNFCLNLHSSSVNNHESKYVILSI